MNEEKEMRNRISSYSDLTAPLTHQRSCHMTYTSLEVHDILREGFDRSPM
jgi:tRNA uridine 5-carboxymethylaminomethyl modification enzyme